MSVNYRWRDGDPEDMLWVCPTCDAHCNVDSVIEKCPSCGEQAYDDEAPDLLRRQAK